MAYKNGGGAFFVPYLIAMITAGIPFIILEFSVGSKIRSSVSQTFAKLSPKMDMVRMVANSGELYYIGLLCGHCRVVHLFFLLGI